MALVETGAPDFPRSDRFEIVRQLGAGGMGIVYEAIDRKRGARIALKTLQRLDGESLLRFKREYRALQDLRHPNLISLGDLVEERGSWFFTMDLVHGLDFLQYVRGYAGQFDATASGTSNHPVSGERRGAEFDEQLLRDSLRQLAEGIAFLHASGNLHRDLKPPNVLVDETGRVVILDLGLVYDMVGPNHSTEQKLVGTAAYMSPEQAATKKLGPETDWYSVGVMLYQALTGRLPHAGTFFEVLLNKQSAEPAAPSSIQASIPADLDALCVELLRIDPTKRPRGDEILERLGAAPPRTSRPSDATLFIGRREELAVLVEAFEAVRDGEGHVVLIRGDSGLGKSALVRRFAETIAKEALVLAGRCYERESVPYRAFDGVIDAISRYMSKLPSDEAAALLPRFAPLLAQVFPVLLRVEAIARAPKPQLQADPHELRRRAFDALRELFARVADRRRLVVVIDDLQWADADSLRLLGELLREPEAPGLLFVAMARTLPDGQEWASRARSLRIEALPPDDARELATVLVARTPSATILDPAAISEAAAGHPLFIDTLIRHAAARPESGERLDLDEALWAQVTSLPDDVALLVETLCVASVPLPARVATRAAGLDGSAAGNAIAVLRSAHLLRVTAAEELEAYHDRVRETVLRHLPADRTRVRHEQLAVALTAEPDASAEALAIHWHGAGDDARAAEHAALAADGAFAGLAYARAARLYKMALDLSPPDGGDRLTLWRRLGDSLTNSGRGPDAASAYLSARALASDSEVMELQRLAVERLLTSGRVDDGLVAADELLMSVGLSYPKTSGRALISALATRAWLRVRGTRFRVRTEAALSASELGRLDVCLSMARGLVTIDSFRGFYFTARAAALALRAGEPSRVAVGLTFLAITVSVERGVRASATTARLLEQAASAAEQSGDPYAGSFVAAGRVYNTAFEGRFRTASQMLPTLIQQWIEQHPGHLLEVNGARTLLQTSYWLLGEVRLQRFAATQYLREAEERGNLSLAMFMTVGDGNLTWLMLDDPVQAEETAAHYMQLWSQRDYHQQHWNHLFSTCSIDLYRGEPRRALERLTAEDAPLRRSMLPRTAFQGVLVRDIRSRVMLADAALRGASERRERLRQVRAEVSWLRRNQAAWGCALADLFDASTCALEGRTEDTVAGLQRAVASLDAADLNLYAACARWRLGDLLGGDDGAALRARGHQFMEDGDIRAPEKVLRLLTPGFDSEGARLLTGDASSRTG